MTTTFTTSHDAEAYVTEALGDYADSYDIQAIAAAMVEYRETRVGGRVVSAGLVIKDEYDAAKDPEAFWGLCDTFAH